MRVFRFNCPRICPRIFRKGRFSSVFGAWASDCKSSIAGSNPAGASSDFRWFSWVFPGKASVFAFLSPLGSFPLLWPFPAVFCHFLPLSHWRFTGDLLAISNRCPRRLQGLAIGCGFLGLQVGQGVQRSLQVHQPRVRVSPDCQDWGGMSGQLLGRLH